MYQVIVTEEEAGQRLDKYLHRILPNAGSGFLYKMLRKKNITLNDKKAGGGEKTGAGDVVKIYFADETLDKFAGTQRSPVTGRADLPRVSKEYQDAYRKIKGIGILYENEHILLADKPAGVLSQKAKKDDLSLNEWLIGYLLDSGFMDAGKLSSYKPSVCNRLDRNTGGIVLCAKSLKGAQRLGELLKTRELHKYYQLYVKGRLEESCQIEGVLTKDEKRNKVSVQALSGSDADDLSGRKEDARGAYIKTAYRPLRIEGDKTLLEVELITGKPHQIRAHLSGIGHPLLGDYKYGDRAWNDLYRKKYQVMSQLLYAYKVVFPRMEAPFEDISGRTFLANLPEIFRQVSDMDNHR